MTNKIKNRLVIIGYDEQVEQVRTFLKADPDKNNKEKIIDFNNIIKMPPELDIEYNPIGQLARFLLFGEDDGFGMISREEAIIKFAELSSDDKKKAFELALIYQENILKFGHATKISWMKKNWRINSNAFDQSDEFDSEINFTTNYDGVPFLIEKLSNHFPTVQFLYCWSIGSVDYECVYVDGILNNLKHSGDIFDPEVVRYYDLDTYYKNNYKLNN